MERKLIYFMLVALLISFSATTFAAEEINQEQAIQLALEQNSELEQLRAEVATAKAQLKEARGAFYPTVDLGSSYTYTKFGVEPVPPRPNDNYMVKLDLKQPLFLGGQLRSNYQLAKNGVKMSQLKLEQKKEEIIYQVLEEYYNLLKTKKMLQVSEQQVDQNRRYVTVAEVNKEEGITTKADLLQAKVSYNQAQQQLLVAENNLENAKLALQNTLNIKEQKSLEITDSLEWQENSFKLEEVYDYALDNKAAIQLLDLQQQNAELNLKNKKNNSIYPNLNLQASYTASDEEFTISDGDWQTTLSLSYNLFNGGRDKAQIEQKSKELEQAELKQQQTKDEIKLLINRSLLDLRAAKERIKLNQLNLEQAEENLADNELRFKEGMITSLDLLNIQTTYQQVQTQYYQAIYDYNLALARLNKAMGKISEEN
jgi:TolC family type I secretion outer membrane protein